MELGIADAVSHETVRRTLKNGVTGRKVQYWVIPPEADAEFAAGMEEVFDTYTEPYDPKRPVVCMDEQPVQLMKETRAPIPATKDRPKRVDYEYDLAGTASLFLFCEPLAGRRYITVRYRRTKVDWAREGEELLRTHYASAENELSSMTGQCLQRRRFGTVEEVRRKTATWQVRTNDKQRGGDWQFRVADARIKLKSLYPKLTV